MDLFAISDDSKLKMFNVAAVALGREDAVVECGGGLLSFLQMALTNLFLLCSQTWKKIYHLCVFFLASMVAMLQLVVQKSSGYTAMLKEFLVKNPW